MDKEKRNKILIVVLSFSIGVLIYLLFRSRNLFYYQFIEMLSLDSAVDKVRVIVWEKRSYIPNWVIYSLPDGLWMFSMGIALLHNRIFYREIQKVYNVIYASFFIFEFVQWGFGGHGTFLGTFDKMDLLFFTVGFFFASTIGEREWKRKLQKNIEMNTKEQYQREKRKTLIIVIVFTVLGFFPALV
nr:hypothetical protein [uncultured Cetobacterium sp.]